MKKSITIVITIAFLLSAASSSFAQTKVKLEECAGARVHEKR